MHTHETSTTNKMMNKSISPGGFCISMVIPPPQPFPSSFPQRWTAFYVLIFHLYIFFGEVSVHILCSFLTGLFSHYWVSRISYILDITPLQRFFPSVCGFCHFILLNSKFWRTEVFILMKSNSSNCCFMSCTFVLTCKKSLPNPRLQRFSPMYSFCFRIYISVYDLFWVNFYIWYKVWIKQTWDIFVLIEAF